MKRPELCSTRMAYVLTMDERFEISKRFGVTFFEKAKDCEDVSTTLEEAVQRGHRCDRLLMKMEDDDYLDNWMSGPISRY